MLDQCCGITPSATRLMLYVEWFERLISGAAYTVGGVGNLLMVLWRC